MHPPPPEGRESHLQEARPPHRGEGQAAGGAQQRLQPQPEAHALYPGAAHQRDGSADAGCAGV